MAVYRKLSGVWERIEQIHRKDAGVWENISQMYRRDAGIWVLVFQNAVTITLTDSINVSVASILNNHDPVIKDGTKVHVVVPDGVTIGGTVSGGYALRMDDISRYGELTLYNSGEIQGAGGGGSYKSGSGAIQSTHPFTLVNSATGAIRGGGAGGADGVSTSSYYKSEDRTDHTYAENYDQFRWNFDLYWSGVNKGYLSSATQSNFNPHSDGWWYASWTPSGGAGGLYGISQYHYVYYPATTGGTGGDGEGYNQVLSLGQASPDGGEDGYDGATWATAASPGGDPGIAIQADGVEVKFKNDGLIQGAQNFIGVPL